MGDRPTMNTFLARRLLGRAGHKMLIGARPKSRVTTAPAAGAARPHLAAQNRPGGGRVRSEGRCRMQVSAEARLWWRSRERDDVEAWFEKLSDLSPCGAPPLNPRCRRPTSGP